jgi:hypothetical protein
MACRMRDPSEGQPAARRPATGDNQVFAALPVSRFPPRIWPEDYPAAECAGSFTIIQIRQAARLPCVPAGLYERIDASSWEVDRDETSGVEEKMWLLMPGSESHSPYLFKSVTVGATYTCNEDLAEKAAAEIGRRLGVPCARVDLAIRNESRGSISADLCPKTWEMQHGALLMQDREIPGYRPGKLPGRPGHSVENIRLALDGAGPPPGSDLPFAASGFDVFAGFTVFDAIIANRDRHDENWAVLLPVARDGPMMLCGSYDHANSLGYNLDDTKRLMYLRRLNGVEGWCRKGTAFRYDHTPGKAAPTLVETAARALSLASAEARDYWRAQVDHLSEDDVRSVIGHLPGMSVPARTFTTEVVLVNRKRVLDACA